MKYRSSMADTTEKAKAKEECNTSINNKSAEDKASEDNAVGEPFSNAKDRNVAVLALLPTADAANTSTSTDHSSSRVRKWQVDDRGEHEKTIQIFK